MKNYPAIARLMLVMAALPVRAELATNSLPVSGAIQQPPDEQNWNWHVQNTDTAQGYPGFSA
ncbi:MAG: hypothetical protein ACLQAH_05370 [Limisphaerales bacterium]